MIPPSISSETDHLARQLDDFLSPKYVDQALLQGFVTVVQSKLRAWISADLVLLRSMYLDTPAQVNTAHVVLIDLLQFVWARIHHTLMKYYQQQHAEMLALLAEAVRSYRSKKILLLLLRDDAKSTKSALTAKLNSNFRAVEMRKLHETFLKFVRSASSFYGGIASEILSSYDNPLIPKHYLDELKLDTLCTKAEQIQEEERLNHIESKIELLFCLNDFHSTLSYIIFNCLLNLGNLARHAAQIELAYAQPGKSITEYYRNLKNGGPDLGVVSSVYCKPLTYYSKCIGILPTIHEPYNHIGVIQNALNEKFTAAIWFLRSQSTRDTNAAIGKYNLHSIFTKPWLEQLYNEVIHRLHREITTADANVILMRIVADYFFPEAFTKPFYSCKVETDLLTSLFEKPETTKIAATPSLVSDHLVMLICFLTMKAEGNIHDSTAKFTAFVARYFERYLFYVSRKTLEVKKVEPVLQNLRLILACMRKNHQFCKQRGSELIPSLVRVLNQIVDIDDKDEKEKALDSFREGRSPVRSHYFSEDVKFKDFSPIGCQFKDFNDEHIFSSHNIDLLFGLYFYTDSERIPSFLDIKAIQRIKKEWETNNSQVKQQESIGRECQRYENLMRVNAIVVLSKKLFAPLILIQGDTFVQDKLEVKAIQKPRTVREEGNKASKEKKKLKKNQGRKQKEKIAGSSQTHFRFESQSETHSQSGIRSQSQISSQFQISSQNLKPSLEEPSVSQTFLEIEQMIIGHAPKLLTCEKEISCEPLLEEMVDSIVEDKSGNETGHVTNMPEETQKQYDQTRQKNNPFLQVRVLHPTAVSTQLEETSIEHEYLQAKQEQQFAPISFSHYCPGMPPPPEYFRQYPQAQTPMVPLSMGYYPLGYPGAPNFQMQIQGMPTGPHPNNYYPYGTPAYTSPQVNYSQASAYPEEEEAWRKGGYDIYPHYQ